MKSRSVMAFELQEKIRRLMEKGVFVPNPESVYIDDEVDLERISGNGVTLWPGSRILGADTLILAGVQIGHQGPATVESCWFGPNSRIASGYCSHAVLLSNASLGANAHVRAGTILEESASTAHYVGLKQTLLFPFVTLGSLINFCDVLMAGGTGPRHHSEVGSSYIHFNFTPNQDKATPSLLGDVPMGVMLDQNPIFLGGQGGVVGPSRFAFGTVTVAGTVCRKDHLRPDQMVMEGGGRNASVPHTLGIYRNIRRIVANNLIYIANLIALRSWYESVRSRFVSKEAFPVPLLTGLQQTLASGIEERLRQMGRFVDKLSVSLEILISLNPDASSSPLADQKREVIRNWPEMEELFNDLDAREVSPELRDRFLAGLEAALGSSSQQYIPAIQSLPPSLKSLGSQWLQEIVKFVMEKAWKHLPSLSPSK